MKNGIVFLWSEITALQELMKIMEKKNFKYIEHFTIVHLSSKKAFTYLDEAEKKSYLKLVKEKAKAKEKIYEDNSEDLAETEESTDYDLKKKLTSFDFLLNKLSTKKNIKINDIFSNEEDEDNFFRKSKSVLLMFRRVNFNHFNFLYSFSLIRKTVNWN